MHSSVYKARPRQAKRAIVNDRSPLPPRRVALPTPITVDGATECHVTPPVIADKMVRYLNPKTYPILEPSAGTGNLIKAIISAGHDPAAITAVERHIALSHSLHPMGLGCLINQCFLDYAQREKGKTRFSRIIMNPPFRNIKAHMNAAISLLGNAQGQHARLVALVPISYRHSNARDLERLPCNVFSTAKVSTKLVLIEQ